MSMPRWLYCLLLFSGLAILFAYFPVPPLLLFVLASLGIIPLAALVGQSVERIAEHTGEALGGLLFATFGNATELIIGIFALREGLVDVVRAAIIGAILCNVLLVLGIATCVGSFKHGRLRFERRTASQYASLLALCIAGLVLPAFAELFASHFGQHQVVARGLVLSEVIAVMLLVGYLLSILFSVFHVGDRQVEDEEDAFQPILGTASETALTRLQRLRRAVARGRHPRKPACFTGWIPRWKPWPLSIRRSQILPFLLRWWCRARSKGEMRSPKGKPRLQPHPSLSTRRNRACFLRWSCWRLPRWASPGSRKSWWEPLNPLRRCSGGTRLSWG